METHPRCTRAAQRLRARPPWRPQVAAHPAQRVARVVACGQVLVAMRVAAAEAASPPWQISVLPTTAVRARDRLRALETRLLNQARQVARQHRFTMATRRSSTLAMLRHLQTRSLTTPTTSLEPRLLLCLYAVEFCAERQRKGTSAGPTQRGRWRTRKAGGLSRPCQHDVSSRLGAPLAKSGWQVACRSNIVSRLDAHTRRSAGALVPPLVERETPRDAVLAKLVYAACRSFFSQDRARRKNWGSVREREREQEQDLKNRTSQAFTVAAGHFKSTGVKEKKKEAASSAPLRAIGRAPAQKVPAHTIACSF